MLRVGFHVPLTGQSWLGGLSYFRNLFRALLELPERPIEPVLLCGHGAELALARDYPPMRVLQTGLLDWRSPAWVTRRLWLAGTGRDRMFEAFLRRHGIAALSHSGGLGRGSVVPSLAWIPDFQHLHQARTGAFSKRDIEARNREYRRSCDAATRVLVSSDDALGDLRTFYPEGAAKARVLRFVADVPRASELPSEGALAQRYGFSGRYIFLPNQFWAHKNHRLVVDALAHLPVHARPLVLATGNTADPRQPAHFEALMAHVRACGVDDAFRVLGVVPYLDLMGLMRHAIAVLNPSRFEGWSTTVEEAKSMGKRVVLSDIGVHREQCAEGGVFSFFSPDRADELAAQLRAIWQDDADDEPRMALAAAELPARRQRFARTFHDILRDALVAHAEAA